MSYFLNFIVFIVGSLGIKNVIFGIIIIVEKNLIKEFLFLRDFYKSIGYLKVLLSFVVLVRFSNIVEESFFL